MHDKGVEPALAGRAKPSPKSRRLHRPARRTEIASTRTSQILGPDSEETATKLQTRVGVQTEVSNRIVFDAASGPTERAQDRVNFAIFKADKTPYSFL